MKVNGAIEIHFDGDIVENHKVSVRTLGKTLTHLQSAIDRAYLDLKYDGVWKYARMKGDEYIVSDFTVLEPRPGGLILDMINSSESGKAIVDRISNALKPAFDEAILDAEEKRKSYFEQVSDRKAQLHHGIKKSISYEDLLINPDPNVTRKFGDRAIVKEVDQILSIIRSRNSGESEVEITCKGTKETPFAFKRYSSSRFHHVVSEKGIGEPVTYEGRIRSLDRAQKTGKFIIAASKRTINLHLVTEENFDAVHPYLKSQEKIRFVGCPLIEYGAFDPNSGDIFFIQSV